MAFEEKIIVMKFRLGVISLTFINFEFNLADHSDLGIIGKIFSPCRSWV